MPIRYTVKQVADIFESKNCSLLDTEYKNQLQKLNYIACCGHKHTISLKMFLIGHGLKCRNCALEIPTFQYVCKTFLDKGCSLSMNEDEFYKLYKNNRTKLNYTALCGHNNIVCLSNFMSLNQGINCPSCVNTNTGEKLRQLRSGENKNSSIEQEFSCIQYFISIINETFVSNKSFDGCKSDIILKSKTIDKDLWIGIQVKTTCNKTDKDQYYFRLNGTNYNNCLIICICLQDKKMWLIPYEDVNGQKTIGIAKTSKYNKYEVTIDNINDKLFNYYSIMNTFSFDILNTPTSYCQKQEQEYRKLRETKIHFIEFIYPNMEGTVYDFKIGNFKIQEKGGFICKNNPNSFGFILEKSSGKHKRTSYEKGDNDFYWLNCKNGKFYVIPESILIEKGFVSDNCDNNCDNKCKQHLYVSPTNNNTKWANDYLFDYDNLDKDQLLQLFL
jgi:hypothetical protein